MDAALWMELANSDRHDYLGAGKHVDSLDDPAWLEGYLRRWGFEAASLPRERLVPALRRLRLDIQKRADAVALGHPVKPGDLGRLNRYLAGAPLVRRLDASGGRVRVELEPLRPSVPSVLAEIVNSFAETLSSGELSRIKTCRNEACRWIFRDTSKNKTRRWCGPTCGNLMKVRRFRRRRKA